MSHFNVLIDSNIFMAAKYNFNNGSLRNLKKYCDDGIVTLFTNDIILREVRAHINDDVSQIARKAKNAIKQHSELFYAIPKDVYQNIETTILAAPKSLCSHFEEYVKDATLLPNKNVSVEILFDKYFDRIAPFEDIEKKKCEFPDAVILMSIEQYVDAHPGITFSVISNDDGWHNALKDNKRISLYRNLTELLSEIAAEQKLYTQITLYMGTCMNELLPSTEDWLVSQDWSPIVNTINACIECDDVEDFYMTAITLSPNDVEYIDLRDEFASALYTGTATCFVGFSYIDHSNETYDREDNVYYNTIYGKGAVELEVSFSGSVTVITPQEGAMELNSSSFDEITIEDVEITDYQLTPYRHNDDPYFAECPDCGQPIGIHNDGGNGFCAECALRH